MDKMQKNDRARIVGNDYSGHKFETGDVVIVTEVNQDNYLCRLEGGAAEWFVHPRDMVKLFTRDEAEILTLEDELADWKRRVALLTAVLDYALDYLNENDPVGGGMVQGYWDAMEARS